MASDQVEGLIGQGLLRLLATIMQARYVAERYTWHSTERIASNSIPLLTDDLDQVIQEIGTFVAETGTEVPRELAALNSLASTPKSASNGHSETTVSLLIVYLDQTVRDVESLRVLLPDLLKLPINQVLSRLSVRTSRASSMLRQS